MRMSTFMAMLFGALLMAAGVLLGTRLDEVREDERAKNPTPPGMKRPAGWPAPANEAEPKSEADGIDPTLLRQLVKLEEQIRELTAEHRLLGRKLESAEKLLGFLDEARMGLPNLEAARRNANQVAAAATLRNIVSAQAQLQQSGKIDLDQDGTGEYAGFVEMSGAGNGRMYGTLVPEVLSGAFRVLDKRGRVSRSGYHFRIYVPGKNGRPIGEPQRGFTKDMGIDAELSERAWCAYAWPVSSKSGGEVLFTNQHGDVLVTDDERYRGDAGPPADAAFVESGAITGDTARGRKGSDGNVWKQKG